MNKTKQSERILWVFITVFFIFVYSIFFRDKIDYKNDLSIHIQYIVLTILYIGYRICKAIEELSK